MTYTGNTTAKPLHDWSSSYQEQYEVLDKHPKELSWPVVGRTQFAGYADLRSNTSDEIEGFAGVHFTLDLFNTNHPTLITAGRHGPRPPVFAKNLSEIYQGLNKSVAREQEALEATILDQEFDRNAWHPVYVGQKAIDRILATQIEADIQAPAVPPLDQLTDGFSGIT